MLLNCQCGLDEMRVAQRMQSNLSVKSEGENAGLIPLRVCALHCSKAATYFKGRWRGHFGGRQKHSEAAY